MFEVELTFYDELIDFFSETTSQKKTKISNCERRSVKDLIESFGIPHTELGQILLNGKAVELSYIIQDNCLIEVFPFRSPDHPGSGFSIKGDIGFCCDVHLGTLARRLRLLGLDTTYNRRLTDEQLAEVSIREKRYLLTRDRQLLMRRMVRLGLYIRNKIPEKQVLEVVNRLNLKSRCKPFSRCLVCNGLLQPFKNEGSFLILQKHAKEKH